MACTMREKKKFSVKRCHDKSVIKHLHKRIFPTDEWYDEESVDWVVEDDMGRYVGFCMFALCQKDPNVGHLARAGILTGSQGYGLHRRLIEVRERFARKAKFKTCITYTKAYNVQSMVNLQKCGYRIYAPKKLYADKDCVYWIKHLKKV